MDQSHVTFPIPWPIQIDRTRHAHNDHSPRHAPPIPRRIASSKRLLASASRCEKPCLFTVPRELVKILNRDLKLAGISKRDDRGRTIGVHALRTTFGTLLSKGGVAPRAAQPRCVIATST
jgi:hypothetical protein